MALRNILTSIHGRRLGLTHGGHLKGEGLAGMVVGDLQGNDYVEGSGPFLKYTQFDDFAGKTISTQWQLRHGSDGACVDFANTSALGGVAAGTMGAGAGVSMAANGLSIDAGVLCFEADKGSLVMEAQVKTDAITARAIYIGFTDQVAALEMPFTLAAGVLTSNATDAAGFLFDTAATAATMKLVGVANDVDATVQDTAAAELATAFHVFRVEIDALGVATFYFDGAQVGTTMAGAVTKTIPLVPVVCGFTRAAGTGTISIDWIRAQQDR